MVGGRGGKDAAFNSLCAVGAFLVTARRRAGGVGPVTIFSQNGGDCTVVNPWPGQPVRVCRAGGQTDQVVRERFTFSTAANQTLTLEPA